MKKLFTATIAGWLCSGAAFAEPLSQPDKDYVALGLAAVRVITDCPDYEAIPNSILKLSGQIGVDPGVVRAVEQVLRTAYGQDHNRSQLIPEVTRLMNDTDDGLSHGAGRKQAEVLQAVGRSSDRKRPDPEETVSITRA